MNAERKFRRLSELLDVDLTGLQDGDSITYDAGTEKWVRGTGGGGGGGGSNSRYVTATLLGGESTILLSLSAGEAITAVMPQRSDAGILLQGIDVSGTDHTIQFSEAPDDDLELLVTIKTA